MTMMFEGKWPLNTGQYHMLQKSWLSKNKKLQECFQNICVSQLKVKNKYF